MTFKTSLTTTNIIYRVGEYTIDFERNQIICHGNIETVEPKVMDVLRFFIEHAGDVIHQEKLFQSVWPNQIFSQSLVQRAIAILRKSLGDDAKNQTVIKTHPKKGYSFIAKVECLTSPISQKNIVYRWSLLCALIAIVIVVAIKHFQKSEDLKLDFSEIKPITSTELNAYKSKFSPDGSLIAYIQDNKSGKQDIWISNVNTGDTLPITTGTDLFHSIAWSPDGEHLAYVAKDSKNYTSYNLGVIELNKSQMGQITTTVKLSLDDVSYVSSIEWSKSDNWYFVVWESNDEQQSKILSFDLNNNQLITLIESSYKNRFSKLALSPNQKFLGITHYSHPENFEIGTFDLHTRNYLTLTKIMSQHLEISWHPGNQFLLANTEDEATYFDLEGNKKILHIPDFQNVSNIDIAPDGNKITYTQNRTDSDLYMYKFTDKEYQMIVNSSAIDIAPRFAPDNLKISYLSKRSGYMQVYLLADNNESLLFNNPEQKDILGPAIWSPDGELIAISQTGKILLINTDSKEVEEIALDYGNMFLYDWYSNENALLVGFITNNGFQSAKINLETFSTENLDINNNGDFKLSPNDELVFTDGKSIFIGNNKVNIKANEDFLISSTIANTNKIIFQAGTEDKQSLYSYDIATGTQQFLMDIPRNIWRIEDFSLDNKSILFTGTMDTDRDIMLVK